MGTFPRIPRAEYFAGKRVAIVGANLSGIEIALQLVERAQKGDAIEKSALPNSTSEARGWPAGLCAFRHRLPLQLAVLCSTFCTIFFKFAACPSAEGWHSSPTVFSCDGNVVSPLVGHVAHPNFLKSLFFVGLTLAANPFPCFDIQTNEWPKHCPKYFHRLGSDQWEYFDWLADLSGVKRVPKVMEKMNKFNIEQRRKNPLTYRNIRYRIVDENIFKIE
ncbi:hypothetical protein niasHS_017891 [Heterodera schachtii]|uniref:Flavin-containing monooxygenase n=1 Tax=Heterodera schachtii TaxID=97005 RepID=A0ABD2I4U2_HETSC